MVSTQPIYTGLRFLVIFNPCLAISTHPHLYYYFFYHNVCLIMQWERKVKKMVSFLSIYLPFSLPPPEGKVWNIGMPFPMLPVYHSEVSLWNWLCLRCRELYSQKKNRGRTREQTPGAPGPAVGQRLKSYFLAPQSGEDWWLCMRASPERGAHHCLHPTGHSSVTYRV